MQFMDAFVREKWDDMGTFIGNVSDPSIPSLPKGFQGYIDLGKEFAKLHAFFVEVLPSLDKVILIQRITDKKKNFYTFFNFRFTIQKYQNMPFLLNFMFL